MEYSDNINEHIVIIKQNGTVINGMVNHPEFININDINGKKIIDGKKTNIIKLFEYDGYLYIMFSYNPYGNAKGFKNKYKFTKTLKPTNWNGNGDVYIAKYIYRTDGTIEICPLKDWTNFIKTIDTSYINNIFYTFDEKGNLSYDTTALDNMDAIDDDSDVNIGYDDDDNSEEENDDDEYDDDEILKNDEDEDEDNDDYGDEDEDDDYELTESATESNSKSEFKSKINIDNTIDNIENKILKKDEKLLPVAKLYIKRQKVVEKFTELFKKNKLDKNINSSKTDKLSKVNKVSKDNKTTTKITKLDLNKLSREIERGIYNYSIQYCNNRHIYALWMNDYFNKIYVAKARHLYGNIDDKSYIKNNELVNIIVNETVKPEDIAFMDRTQVYPSLWKPILDERKIKNEIIKDSASGCVTNSYRCPNKACGAMNANYTEVQTRSADEPMTVFLSCIECGKQWKRN